MAYDVQKLLDIALNEVGYLEKETYDQLDEKITNAGDKNYTKYQRDLARISYFNSSKKGVAWCAVFVAWCFVQAFGKAAALRLLCQPSSGNCGAGCNSQMNYYKNKKRFYTDSPQVGDQILFWSSNKTEASHTGIVYKVDNKYVYTVEGNTSSSSGVVANGGAVAKKKYKLTNDRIAGYGRPNYGVINASENQDSVEQDNDTAPTVILTPAWVHGTTSGAVNYRTRPSKLAPRVAGMQKIKEGEEVGVNTADGTWASVEYKGYKGYIMVEFLTYDKPVNEQEEIIETPDVSVGIAWVNSENGIGTGYRQRPNDSAPYVTGATYIPHGEQVKIKTTDGTWAAVEYQNYRGYVLMKDLMQDQKEETAKPEVMPEKEAAEQQTYTTVQGDTLWKISAKFLGAGYKYRKIMKANGMKNTIIRPGMVLKIPEE